MKGDSLLRWTLFHYCDNAVLAQLAELCRMHNFSSFVCWLGAAYTAIACAKFCALSFAHELVSLVP
jgi:hypothetical protein